MPHNPNTLKVLERAFALAVDVHRLVDRHEQALTRVSPGMRSQILRAVDSIALNLTEAAGQDSVGKTLTQIAVAVGSANELELQLKLARALNAIPHEASFLLEEVVEVRKMSFGWRRYLRERAGLPT